MHNRNKNRFYFINKFDQSHIDKQKKETIIIFRNYDNGEDKRLILKIKDYCKKKGNKFLLSNNIKLAINLNLDGAYIPSFNYCKKHLSYSFKKNFILLGSAHNLKQIRNKELQGVTSIFLSSLFRQNTNYLGINRFRLLSLLTSKKVIVLGGLTSNNIKKLNLLEYFGFAGITFFESAKKNGL
jgi:thiamine-phosphate pyrophosphorylase